MEIDFIRIQVVARPPYNPSLLKRIRIVDPPLELDSADLIKGFFVTKERMDITKTAVVEIIYNDQVKKQDTKPGEEINKISFEGREPGNSRDIKTFIGLIYANPDIRPAEKIKSIVINRTGIELDPTSNLGSAEITTAGTIDVSEEFSNVSEIEIQNFSAINAAIFVINTEFLLRGRSNVTNDSFFSFTKTLTAPDIKLITTTIKDFSLIRRAADLKVENFYCFLLPENEIKEIRKILTT